MFVHLCASYTREMYPTVIETSTMIPASGTSHQTTLSTNKTAPIADASTNRVLRAVNKYTELENVSI